MLRDLARSDPSAAVTLSMHSHLVAFQVWRHHHGQDASPQFEKVVGGAYLVSTGASDWVSSGGSARKVDGGYRVSARKSPASGCEMGTVLVTSIRWEQAGAGAQVLHCAIPFSAEGVSVEQTWDTVGLRATGSHTVVLDDVFVPDTAVSLVRPADVWHPVWNAIVGAAMPLIMAAYAGIADAAVASALEAVSGRSEDHLFQIAGEMTNAHLRASDAVDAMFSGRTTSASRTPTGSPPASSAARPRRPRASSRRSDSPASWWVAVPSAEGMTWSASTGTSRVPRSTPCPAPGRHASRVGSPSVSRRWPERWSLAPSASSALGFAGEQSSGYQSRHTERHEVSGRRSRP
jgi:hypothetical protein